MDITFELHPAQMEVYQDPHRFKVIAAGRRWGKTTLATAKATTAALDPRNKKLLPVFIIAPTQAQAKLLYWRQLINQLHPLVTNTNVNEGMIYLNNDVMIGVKGADNPESLRGPGLWYAALDEYGDMKPHTWDEIIRPTLVDSRGEAMFIGTPTPERNHFYDLWKRGQENDPDFKSWHFESITNPFLPPGEIEEARRTMSTEAFHREFLASFETELSGDFKKEWIKYYDEPSKKTGRFVAIDLAGFTDLAKARTAAQRRLDEHVIVTAYCDDEWDIEDVQVGRWGTKECAVRIVDTLLRVEPDAWGMENGALYRAVLPYVQDEFRRRGHVMPEPVPLSHENKTKPQRIAWALQGRMEHGRVRFRRAPWNKQLEEQLLMFPNTKVHDDIVDALAYLAQLTKGRLFNTAEIDVPDRYWEPADKLIGF